MPEPSREELAVALFDYLAAANIKTVDENGNVSITPAFSSWIRNSDPLSDVLPEQMPALRFFELEEVAITSGGGMPTIWERTYSAYIYVWSVNVHDGGVAATVMNNILDALENSLPATPRQNLGYDAINEVRIHGKIQRTEGIWNNKSVAIVPIRMLIASNAQLIPRP